MRTPTCTRTHICANMHIYTCVGSHPQHTHTQTHAHTHAHTHARAHTLTHIHTCARTHTHTLSLSLSHTRTGAGGRGLRGRRCRVSVRRRPHGHMEQAGGRGAGHHPQVGGGWVRGPVLGAGGLGLVTPRWLASIRRAASAAHTRAPPRARALADWRARCPMRPFPTVPCLCETGYGQGKTSAFAFTRALADRRTRCPAPHTGSPCATWRGMRRVTTSPPWPPPATRRCARAAPPPALSSPGWGVD